MQRVCSCVKRTVHFHRIAVKHRTDATHDAIHAAAEAPASRVKELKTDQEYRSVLQDATKSNALSVFDYTAAWCGPCESLCTSVRDVVVSCCMRSLTCRRCNEARRHAS